MSQRPIIVFDVNETLLDLEALRPTFERIFADPAALRLWFGGLITYSEALTLAGVYVPFTEIGSAVLQMLAATRGISVTEGDAAELTERFASMPAHPDVPTALRRLREERLPTTRWRSRGASSRMPAWSTCLSGASAWMRRFAAISRRPRPTTPSPPRSRSIQEASA